MNELMRDEILDQPHAVEICLPALRAQSAAAAQALASQTRRVVLAGSGDSYFAPWALQNALRRRLQAAVHVATALEAARYWRYGPGDLLAAISISGESARVLEAARRATESGAALIAITANGDSSLARLSRTPVVIPFRSRSRTTPHTTDYTTTLLALATLAEAFAGEAEPLLDRLAGLVRSAVEGVEERYVRLGKALAAAESFYFIGAGPNLATAQYAAAKFWEAGGLRAFAFETEEFAHGPHLVVDADDAVVVVAPSGQSDDRARVLASSVRRLAPATYLLSDGGAAEGVDLLPLPAVDEEWSPLPASIPLQWLSWAVATAKGYDVLTKEGRHANAKEYESIHWQLVRG